MILHLVTDEKFTDYAIKQFSAPEMESEFVIIPSNFLSGESEVIGIEKTRAVLQGSPAFDQLLRELGRYTAVILHGMHWAGWETRVLNAIPNHVHVAWVLWGGDVYGRSDIKDTFKAPITRIISKLRILIKRNREGGDTSWELPYCLFQRVDYCMTSQTEEYDYAVQFFNVPFKRLWYTYYTIEEMVGSLISERATGNSIWLGNSATESNNHIDALLKLYVRRSELKNRKLIAPLSYPSCWVRGVVSKFGKLLFGDCFVPIVNYMPREVYNSKMLDCSVMIMPHYMSQGMGNVFTGLWLGMRVYMSKRNISFDYLKRIGLAVFSLEDDLKKYGLFPLLEEEFLQNRKILSEVYGRDHVMAAVREIVQELSTPRICK